MHVALQVHGGFGWRGQWGSRGVNRQPPFPQTRPVLQPDMLNGWQIRVTRFTHGFLARHQLLISKSSFSALRFCKMVNMALISAKEKRFGKDHLLHFQLSSLIPFLTYCVLPMYLEPAKARKPKQMSWLTHRAIRH